MTKFNTLATCFAFLHSMHVLPQCTMEVTGTYEAACFSAGVQWHITDGTAPYQITITSLNFSGEWTTVSDLSDGAEVFEVGSTFAMHITVTDALDCVAQVSLTPDVPHLFGTSDESIVYAVNGNTGTAQITWTSASVACAPQELTYTIRHPETYEVFDTGLVGAAWTEQPTTGYWTYNALLPSGRYVVEITGEVPCPPGSDFYPSVDCWRSNFATEIWVPTPGNPGVNVALRVMLGGVATTAGLMSDALRTSGLVPLTDPYVAAGYVHTGYTGSGSTTASTLAVTGQNAVVDWVIVELRSATAPYTILRSRPALLQRNWIVADLDGDVFINFPDMLPGEYRIVIRHRNHLGVMTFPFQLGVPVTLIDTQNLYTGLYGDWFVVSPSRRLWPGDVNGDGLVKYVGSANDRDAILSAIGGANPTNTVNGVYSTSDVNLDGVVKYTGANNDRDIILQTIGGTVPTAVRTQQLP